MGRRQARAELAERMGQGAYRLWVAFTLGRVVVMVAMIGCIGAGIGAVAAHDFELLRAFAWALAGLGALALVVYGTLGVAAYSAILHRYGYRGWAALRASSDLPINAPAELDQWAEARRRDERYLSRKARRLRGLS
jgi:hypothetical protein